MPELNKTPPCDFFGCGDCVCLDDLSRTPPAARFCQEHRDECSALLEPWDAPAMVRFWVRSQGGAERLRDEVLFKLNV